MMRLSREVRFALVDDNYATQITNSWAGWPSSSLLVPRFTLVTTVEGTPEKKSGYICNIKLLDVLVRDVVTSEVIPCFKPGTTPELILRHVHRHCVKTWKVPDVPIVEQTLILTPYLKFTISSKDNTMVCLTQQFEFSASHRLHNEELSDQENRELFGKCNNPNGHGHNYVVEVSLQRTMAEGEVNLHQFEAKVKELVIDRLDHKHLNCDVEHFASVNPSVENIAVAIYDWLYGQFGDSKLAKVRVYETPKTWADYSGDPKTAA